MPPSDAPPRRSPVLLLVLLLLLGCATASALAFAFALHSDAEIEQALEERYDADISFDSQGRRRVLVIGGERRNCEVEGHLFSLDDVAIRCFVPDEPPALR